TLQARHWVIGGQRAAAADVDESLASLPGIAAGQPGGTAGEQGRAKEGQRPGPGGRGPAQPRLDRPDRAAPAEPAGAGVVHAVHSAERGAEEVANRAWQAQSRKRKTGSGAAFLPLAALRSSSDHSSRRLNTLLIVRHAHRRHVSGLQWIFTCD